MIKLLRSAFFSAAMTWAWKNRSKIMSMVSRAKDDPPADVPPVGYAEVVGDENLIDPDSVSTQS